MTISTVVSGYPCSSTASIIAVRIASRSGGCVRQCGSTVATEAPLTAEGDDAPSGHTFAQVGIDHQGQEVWEHLLRAGELTHDDALLQEPSETPDHRDLERA